jgi:Protein of unknown function (DUF2510)
VGRRIFSLKGKGIDMSTPNGWHVDTTDPGRERYWDGNIWTNQIRTLEGTPLEDSPPAGTLQPPPEASDSTQASARETVEPTETSEVNPAPGVIAVSEEIAAPETTAASEATPQPVLVELADQTDAHDDQSDALAGTRHHRMRRRTAVKVLSVVMAMVIVGVGAFLLFGRGKSADAAVSDAVSSALASKTADLDVTGSGGAAGATIAISGTGAIDFGQNALQTSLKISGGPTQITEQTVYLNKTIYLNLGNEIGQVLPGKSWLSLDVSQLTQGNADTSLGGAGSLGNDPAAALRVLAQNGNTATDLGPSTINGVNVEGYAVTISPAAIKAELANANLPAWLQQAAKSVSNPNIGYKVYVDGSDQLARLTTDLSETVSALTVHEAITMDFTNYGTAVNITAPPSGQVATFQSFLQAAQSLKGSSTD